MTDVPPPLAGVSSRQGRTRDHNEDSSGTPEQLAPSLLKEKGWLYVVADGMGGHRAGEEASQRAVSRIFQAYYADAALDIPASLERAIMLANGEIHENASSNPALQGMGTTVTAAVVHGSELHVANVGDSRAYLVRAGTAQQITLDHSWVEEQHRAGLLSAEQARVHPQRNVITRSLGQRLTVQVDHFAILLAPGDRLLLCTDGLSNVIGDAELARMVGGRSDPGVAAQRLLDVADRHGRDDDATAIVVDLPGGGAAPRATSHFPGWLVWGVAAGALLLMGVTMGLGLALRSARPSPTPTSVPSPSAPAEATPGEVTATVTLSGTQAEATSALRAAAVATLIPGAVLGPSAVGVPIALALLRQVPFDNHMVGEVTAIRYGHGPLVTSEGENQAGFSTLWSAQSLRVLLHSPSK